MKHLADEQLAQWLAGEADEQTQSHLDLCESCRAEAFQLRDGISRYTIALRQQSARAQSAHITAKFAPRKALLWHRLRWAGAGVLTLVLAAPTAWMLHSRSVATAPPTVAAPATHDPAAQISDDELLEAVNNDLSREVPQALAPVTAITVARNEMASSTGRNVSNARGENQ